LLAIEDRHSSAGNQFYNMTLVATDGGDPPNFGRMRINVLLKTPIYPRDIYVITIEEKTHINETLFSVNIYDDDDDISWELTYELSHLDLNTAVLSINPYTGDILE